MRGRGSGWKVSGPQLLSSMSSHKGATVRSDRNSPCQEQSATLYMHAFVLASLEPWAGSRHLSRPGAASASRHIWLALPQTTYILVEVAQLGGLVCDVDIMRSYIHINIACIYTCIIYVNKSHSIDACQTSRVRLLTST